MARGRTRRPPIVRNLELYHEFVCQKKTQVQIAVEFDISQPRRLPREIWHVQLSGCIESTPAVWHGMIWVGARGGQIYGIGDPR